MVYKSSHGSVYTGFAIASTFLKSSKVKVGVLSPIQQPLLKSLQGKLKRVADIDLYYYSKLFSGHQIICTE